MGFMEKIKSTLSGENVEKAKGVIGDVADKATDVAGGVADKATDALGASVDKVDEVTGGKYSDQLDKAKNVIDREGDGSEPVPTEEA